MTREEALKLLNEKLSNKNLIKHSLAVEAAMRELAIHFNENPEIWSMAGLLHDLDYEATANDWTKHGVLTEEWLQNSGISQEIFDIIKAHNSDALNIKRNTLAEKAIFAVDPVTGLITAATLMNPERKIANLEVKSIMKKFKNSKFAAGANREHIATCQDCGLSLEEFITIVLRSMQKVSDDLGL